MNREHATTTQRQAVRRDDDGELLGHVREDPDGHVPLTVFGAELGPATTAEAAHEVVTTRGLASLAERWWLREPDGSCVRVWLLEVRPDRVKVAGSDPSWGPVQGTWVAGHELSLLPAGTPT